MDTLADDCLGEALSYFCAHEVGRLCAVSKRYGDVCFRVKNSSSCLSRCVYRHHVVKGAAAEACCYAHTTPDGSMFVQKYRDLVANLNANGGPRFPLRSCKGAYVHCETPDELKRFLFFVRAKLRVHMATAGTCCSGKGIKIHGVWVE